MDREKVIKGLECLAQKQEQMANPCSKCDYHDRPNFAFCVVDIATDAIALLKEQEAVEPYIDIDEAKCPICKVRLTRQELIGDDVLFEDFFDYCPHCGKPILWEGSVK